VRSFAVVSGTIAELLACPACGGSLDEKRDGVVCMACGRSYPRQNDAPVLLLEPPADQAPPGRVGHALASIVAQPRAYDLVQRLAGLDNVARRIRPVLAQMEDALVLDAGAGTGIVEALLPTSARYLWLDPDPRKLRGFRAKSHAPALLADATRLPLRDRSVDWALSTFVSHHLDELRRVSTRVFFLDAVLTPRLRSRLLWRYDRGRHPRTADALRDELGARFRLVTDEEFAVHHRYLLLTGE
jgi:SAM-dependent methyltransferase